MQYQPQRTMREDQDDTTTSSSVSGSSSVRNVRSRKSASAFRTISEVAELLDVQQHVLRFWETKFSQVRPLKRGGGRRYYRPEDVELLQTIHHLLYTEGYTIKGVQKLLKEQGKNAVVENTQVSIANDMPAAPSQLAATSDQEEAARRLSQTQRRALEVMLAELKELRALIKA